MTWRLSVLMLMAAIVAAWPARAQEMVPAPGPLALPVLTAIPLFPPSGIARMPAIALPRVDAMTVLPSSPSAAPSLAIYAAYGMLQALDVHSTLNAVGNGGVEGNPLLRSLVSSPAGLITLKAASTVGVIYFIERLRKKHPAAALALSIGVSSLQAYVVVHNYRVAQKR
jgi:hypothetical protein